MKKLLLISFICSCLLSFAQQSPQYSQYSFNNFGYNPAFAGTTKCFDFKAGYRMQWVGFEGAPRTTFASAHMALGKKNYNGKGKHAVGLYVEQDELHLTTRTYVKGAYAYHTKISSKMTMGLGIYAGIQQYATEDVFSGDLNPDPVLAAASGSALRYPDIMPGVLLYSKRLYISFSINQLYFKSINLGQEEKQVNQYYFGMGHKSTHGNWTMFKSFLLKQNIMGPPALDLNLAWTYKQKITLGAGYRVGESAIANVKFKLSNAMTITYAFDFPLNKIYGNYGHEIMIGFSRCGGGGVGQGGGAKAKNCWAYD
jgi:type IX secretion system PorP/SprF family membrane protein